MKRTIEAAVQSEQVEPAGPIPLAELAAEGVGTVDALARQLADRLVRDDIGRRAVPRHVARDLLAERAAAEERQREKRQRRAEERAKRQPRPPRGVPALPGMSAFESMAAHAGDDARKRDAAGRRLEAWLRGESVGERFSPSTSRERGE